MDFDKDKSIIPSIPSKIGSFIFKTFRTVCNASWIFFSIFVTFYGPVIYETERRRNLEIEDKKNAEKFLMNHN
jgi:hypothetical protein